MDQLIYASLSHTHYWYEVGMLKVPASSFVTPAAGTVEYVHKSDVQNKWDEVYVAHTQYH